MVRCNPRSSNGNYLRSFLAMGKNTPKKLLSRRRHEGRSNGAKTSWNPDGEGECKMHSPVPPSGQVFPACTSCQNTHTHPWPLKRSILKLLSWAQSLKLWELLVLILCWAMLSPGSLDSLKQYCYEPMWPDLAHWKTSWNLLWVYQFMPEIALKWNIANLWRLSIADDVSQRISTKRILFTRSSCTRDLCSLAILDHKDESQKDLRCCLAIPYENFGAI